MTPSPMHVDHSSFTSAIRGWVETSSVIPVFEVGAAVVLMMLWIVWALVAAMWDEWAE